MDSCDAKGDVSSALILDTFECNLTFNRFTAEVHCFVFFIFLQPWHMHELRWFTLDLNLDQGRIRFGMLRFAFWFGFRSNSGGLL